MLLHLDAGMEGLRGVIRQDGDVCLHEDFSGIHTGIHIMDGAAGLFGTGLQRLAPGLHTGESGEQSRVNVENTVREGVEQRFFDKAHEAGQANHIHPQGLQFIGNGLLNLQREFVFVAAAIHHLCGHAVLAGALEDVSVGVVGEDDDHLGIQATVFNGIKNRLAIAAGTGTEYCETYHNTHTLPYPAKNCKQKIRLRGQQKSRPIGG